MLKKTHFIFFPKSPRHKFPFPALAHSPAATRETAGSKVFLAARKRGSFYKFDADVLGISEYIPATPEKCFCLWCLVLDVAEQLGKKGRVEEEGGGEETCMEVRDKYGKKESLTKARKKIVGRRKV